jgi:hypothetical protein
MSRKRDRSSVVEDMPSPATTTDVVVTPNVAVEEMDESILGGDSGDATSNGTPLVSTAPAPQLPHFHMTLDGFFWYQAAARQLLDALPVDRPTQYVEVGVFKGQSLAWLGIEIANRGLPTTLHAVDTFAGWPGVLQGKELRAAFDKNMAPVRAALGDRLVVHAVSSVDAAQRFPAQSLDVVWLDADHSYEAVRADIRAWLPKLRPGGTIGGDDWDWQKGGVAKAVTEAFGKERITLGQGVQNGQPWTWWMVKV